MSTADDAQSRIRQMVEDHDYFKKALERRKDEVRAERGMPHVHGEYIEGCFRCDLSRDESDRADRVDAEDGGR